MLIGLTIAALGAAAASVLITRRIRATLSALTAGTALVAAGEYAARVSVSGGDPELEALATRFNVMAARIADAEASRRRLLDDLSHELRTPLAGMDLLLSAIEDGIVPADEATLGNLRAQVARLTQLAGDLRRPPATATRSRTASGRVRVGEVVTTALEAVSPAFAVRGVALARTDSGDDAAVPGDRVLLGEVLEHLLLQAAEHTPAGGTVTVWRDTYLDAVRVGVRDEGVGVAAEDLPYVFDRFHRSGSRRHDQGADAGAPLARARTIAAAHGGTLTARSAGIGHGTEFVMTLPTRS